MKKNNIDFCYNCKSKIKDTSNSLHVWLIEYECGCKIFGAIGIKDYTIDVKCPK